MDDNYTPKINCRFRIRQDISGFIAFFETRGVLTFNEIGGFIMLQIDGGQSLGGISLLVKEKFPEVDDPMLEVKYIMKELQGQDLL